MPLKEGPDHRAPLEGEHGSFQTSFGNRTARGRCNAWLHRAGRRRAALQFRQPRHPHLLCAAADRDSAGYAASDRAFDDAARSARLDSQPAGNGQSGCADRQRLLPPRHDARRSCRRLPRRRPVRHAVRWRLPGRPRQLRRLPRPDGADPADRDRRPPRLGMVAAPPFAAASCGLCERQPRRARRRRPTARRRSSPVSAAAARSTTGRS